MHSTGPGVPLPRVSRRWPSWPPTSSPVPPVPEAGVAEMRVTPPAATVVVNVPFTVPSRELPAHKLVTFAGPVEPEMGE